MSKRSFPTFLLTFAFLLSAWGNVIAAALCPHYEARAGSIKGTVEQAGQADSEPCHHEMSDMSMDMGETSTHNMQVADNSTGQTEIKTTLENATTADADKPTAAGVVLELPNERCGHCWMHSQPSSGSSTVAALSTSQSVEASAPPVDIAVARPFTFTISITPFKHGPPGGSLPRHVLVNVFRI